MSDSQLLTTPPTTAVELFCLQCDYNLQGLTTTICPECGQPFDPVELQKIFAGQLQPIIPWEDSVDPTRTHYWTTVVAVLADPKHFANIFPARHDAGSAWSYSIYCYLLSAIALYISMIFMANGDDILKMFIIVGIGLSVGVILTETFISMMLAALLRPTYVPQKGAYHFWRGLVHFNSIFFTISTTILSMFFILMSITNHLEKLFAAWMFAVGIVLYIVWWIYLATMIAVRR
ncbi:MAG: hypothetical protein HJJLKODD_01712 [Phycisphaerae bacterium]|nr:hypothetical protein [Phycisphaerae bacterium]